MRRTLALLTLLALAAFSGGCYSSSDSSSSNNSNANANTVTTGATAPPSQPATSNSATVGGARPPQAKPSPTHGPGIKPPTKN